MKLRSLRLFATALVIGALAPFAASAGPATAKADLVDTAVAAGSFKTLAAALTAADLVDTLKGDGPFTVFAPTDAAFAKLPKGTLESLLKPENKAQLVSILKLHVIATRVPLATALAQGSAKSLSGEAVAIAFKDGSVRVNAAKLTAADINTSNGVIHVIDTVLLPEKKAVAAAAMTGSSPARLIALAIERGVPLFNDGQPAACAAIYEVTAESLVALASLPATASQILRTALVDAAKNPDPAERAWTLRRALDRTLATLDSRHTTMR